MAMPLGENRAKLKLSRNELVLCMAVNQMRTPNIAMIAEACGFDALFVDMEHNPTNLETAAGICVAALGVGITPIVRMNTHAGHEICRVLDAGAQGIMVPHVDTADQARMVVQACLFPPAGHRSVGGPLPVLRYRSLPQSEINPKVNRETLLIAMIETPGAVANAAAIAAVEGIDVIHIGASDLSAEMGLAGQTKHPRMRAAYETVRQAASAHGKAWGVGGVRNDPAFQAELLKLGVRYLTCGSDLGYVLKGGSEDVAAIRAMPL
ncbi:aldolase/citrate lyase family protein [Roseomonas sp. CAU 1739]|uniref:HpcH/HpaI aldolase family protein n=1 Tax=Roseomonas sp. CAU 1739 TaxID=3140364 RepID=UPI00325B59F0